VLYIYSASLLRKDPRGLSGLRAALGTQSIHMHWHWMIHNPPSVDRRAARVQFTSCPNGPHPCRLVCAWIVPPRILWESLLSSLTMLLYAAGLSRYKSTLFHLSVIVYVWSRRVSLPVTGPSTLQASRDWREQRRFDIRPQIVLRLSCRRYQGRTFRRCMESGV